MVFLLGGTFFATTPFGFDVLIPVFLAVVIEDFFSWKDLFLCVDKYTTTDDIDFGIWTA